MKALWTCAIICATAIAAYSTQYTYSDTGGTVTLDSTGTILTISGAALASPAGTLSMSCTLAVVAPTPSYAKEWSCTGGSFSLHSNDGSTALTGGFTSGLFTLQYVYVRGVKYYNYALNANIAGALTIRGASRAVLGSVVQNLAQLSSPLDSVNGTIQTGAIYASQRYEPVYISDTANNRIVRLWDIEGDGWTSFGKAGSGVNEFSQPRGISVDRGGKIYVSDSGNCRIVRINNMSGLNWSAFGSCGSGTGQFSNPESIFVDTLGKIYVADTGNNRVVRMDDMTGANFMALGVLGSGTNEFSSPGGIALDSTGKIYVADAGNSRVVSMDDMTGTNWTALADANNPVSVWVDSSNRIYTANTTYSYVVRVDDMTGSNPVYLGLAAANLLSGPRAVFVDPDGAVYVADTGDNRLVRTFDMTGAEWMPFGVLGKGTGKFNSPSGVFVVPATKPIAWAIVQPTALTFPTEVVGTPSPAQRAVLTNIGTAPFTVSSVTTTNGDFTPTNKCTATLAGGYACSASIVFQPSAGGLRTGSLTFRLLGASSQRVSLRGYGALVSVSPSSLTLYESQTGYVTVMNPLTTSTAVSVTISGKGFIQTNNCGSLAPGASCSVTIVWAGGLPPPVFGTLTVTDGSGTAQYVQLIGE